MTEVVDDNEAPQPIEFIVKNMPKEESRESLEDLIDEHDELPENYFDELKDET